MTRRRIWSTMSSSWVAITTVVPVRLIRSSSRMMPTLVAGSRLPVGSSAMRIIGRLTKARAIATRCCSPPESSSGSALLALEPDQVEHLGHHLGDLVRGRPITSRANATFSWTVLLGSSRKSWKTCRCGGAARAPSSWTAGPGPCRRRAPGRWSARSSLRTSRRNVDLPEPGLPDEEDELALLDLDGHVVEGRPGLARVELGDVLEADHSAWRAAGSSCHR
jgi:hypothetical protein